MLCVVKQAASCTRAAVLRLQRLGCAGRKTSRWTHERRHRDISESNHFTMTQALIADMLGVRREGINEAANKLQNLGVIRYRRGRIMVLDRDKLEHLCCECYAVVKRENDSLLPDNG